MPIPIISFGIRQVLPLTLVAVGASASATARFSPSEQGAISLAHLAHFCVRAVLLRQSLYLLAVFNRPPQYVASMAEPFGHLLLISRWMPQHFGRKEEALHVVK